MSILPLVAKVNVRELFRKINELDQFREIDRSNARAIQGPASEDFKRKGLKRPWSGIDAYFLPRKE